jgi:hypothetical protein
MASDAGIYSFANHPTAEALDPFEVVRRRLSIQNALAAQQIQQQQLQQGALALDVAQRDQAAEAAFRAQFMNPAAAAPGLAAAPAPPVLNALTPAGPGPGSAAWDPAAASVLPAAAPGPVGMPVNAAPGADSGPVSGPMMRTPAGVAPAEIPDSALYQAFGSKAPGLIKARNEASSAAAARQQKLGEVREQDQKYWGNLGGAWEHAGFDPRMVPGMLQLAAGHGLQNTPEYQQAAQLWQAGDIDGLKRLTSLAVTPDIRKSIAETGAADALTTGRKTENTQKNVQNAGSFLATVRDQGAWDKYLGALAKEDPAAAAKFADIPWSKQAPAIAQQRALTGAEQVTAAGSAEARAETRRHNKFDEWNATQNREGLDLTPAARDQMATMFATTGTLPNLGMGAAVAKQRAGIINRAAEMYPNVTFASNAAMFSANKKSLADIQGRLDKVSAFESASKKNLDMFVGAADKLPDTGVPWLNTPLRKLSTSGLGSTDMAVVNAARQTALREIARVTNDPNLSGQLSDSARHEVMGLSPENATINQIKDVAKILVADMNNVHTSLSEQRDAIQNRIGVDNGVKPPAAAAAPAPGGAPAPPAAAPALRLPAGSVSVTDPAGGVHYFPNQGAADDFKRLANIR